MDKTLKIIRKGNVGYKKIYVKKGVVNNRRGNKKTNRKYRWIGKRNIWKSRKNERLFINIV